MTTVKSLLSFPCLLVGLTFFAPPEKTCDAKRVLLVLVTDLLRSQYESSSICFLLTLLLLPFYKWEGCHFMIVWRSASALLP